MAYADYRRQGVESPVVSQERTGAISDQNVDAIPFAVSLRPPPTFTHQDDPAPVKSP